MFWCVFTCTLDVCALGWNGILKLEVSGACDKVTSMDCLWYMDESITGSAMKLILLKGAWEFGLLVKISKVLVLSGLTAIFSAPERSPLCGCAFRSLVLTLTLRHGDRKKEVLYKKINIISPVSEVVKRENMYDTKDRLVVVGMIQKLCLYIAVAVLLSKRRTLANILVAFSSLLCYHAGRGTSVLCVAGW